MDIRTYIHLIINNWRILLASAVITVAATLVFTLQQPRIYESESTFVIRPHSSLILQDEFVSTLDTLSRRVEINNTFAEVTTSKLIKDRAAENLGLTSEQRQGLSASGRVLAGTNILRLTVQGRDPEVAQAFAEAVSEETVAYVSNLYDVFELGQLDAASLSRTPVSPKPGLNLTIGLVLGVILGLALIFLREYLNSPGGLQRRFDIIDPDSGVYNRSYLDMRLRQEMSRTHHTGGHLSLALLRVSDRNTVDFKASPSAMPPVAIIIEPLLRDEDLLARYDQSTFVIILPDLSGYEAQAAVEKMRLRLGAAPVAPEHLQRMAGLRGAAGVAELLSADNNEESLLTRAMEALNEAERGTYGRVVLSTPSADGGAPRADSRRQTIPAGPQLVKDTPLTMDAAVNGVMSTGGSSNGIKANGIVTNGANGHGTNGKSAHTNGNGSSAPADGHDNGHRPATEESPETEQSLNTEEPLETEESPEPAELAHEFPAPSAPSLTRAALRLAQQFNIDPASIEGTGKDGRVLKSDVKNYINSLGS